MAKVASVEEQMELFRKSVKESVKEFEKNVVERVNNIKLAIPEDYSDLVREKIENDGCSYSGLKKFRESPLSYVNGLLTPFEQTPAMFKGDVVDNLVTAPKKFIEKFYLVPEKVSRNSNEGKAKYALYEEMAGGRTILDRELFDECVVISEALFKNDKTKYYIERMKNPQKWINFVHKETGLKVRGIVDWESEEENEEYQFFIADLKTTTDASNEGFIRQAAKLWYNGQVGVYTMAYKYKWKFPDFIHVVVETKPPYNTNVFRATSEYIKKSQQEVHNTLMAFKYCLDKNLWHRSYNFILEEVRYTEMKLPGYYTSPYLSKD